MAMRFWYFCEPDYESDYQSLYINGTAEHPFGLPGVKCDLCRQTWGGGRILPFECPESSRNHVHIKDSWPVSSEQHRRLQEEIRLEFQQVGISLPDLLPGDRLQPLLS